MTASDAGGGRWYDFVILRRAGWLAGGRLGAAVPGLGVHRDRHADVGQKGRRLFPEPVVSDIVNQSFDIHPAAQREMIPPCWS